MPVCARRLCSTVTRMMESSDRRKITTSTMARMNRRSAHLKMNLITTRFTIYDLRAPANLDELVNRKSKIVNSHRHIFRPHLQTFILILPNHGGVAVKQFWREFAAGEGKQLLRLFR